MKIGAMMIDLDPLNIDDLYALEQEARRRRLRKMQKAEFQQRMNKLLKEAKDEGFTFIDNIRGFVREPDDFTIVDEHL
jgi:hypothetical protein